MKKLLLTTLLLTMPFVSFAQSRISYTYDAAGNRIKARAIYCLFSIDGKLIKRGDIKAISSKIDMTKLNKGYYILTLYYGKDKSNVKVIKE